MKGINRISLLKNTLIVIFIIVLCFLIELFYFNRDVIKNNNKYTPEIVEFNGMDYDGKAYKTLNSDSYIVLKVDSNNNYVNKLKFNYKSNNSFEWEINEDDNIIKQYSSEIINLAVRTIKINTSLIRINFKGKDITVSNFEVNNKIYINYSRIIFMIVALTSLFYFIKNVKKLYNNLDKTYLIIACILGFLFMLVTPKVIGSSLDDNSHLKNSIAFMNSDEFTTSKAYLISESRNSISTNYFTSLEEQKELYNVIDKSTNDKVVVSLHDYSSKYNKLIYTPFKIGFVIGDILHLPFTITSLLARLLNYIAFVLLIYFAIRISTYMKRIIFLFGLATSSLYLATQFSYDPTIIAGLILAFAIYLRMLEDEKINYKYIIAFILIVIWSCLPKAIYSPFLLLLLFIPNNKFSNKKLARRFKLMVIIIEILLLSTFVLPILLGNTSGDIRGGNVSVSLQLKYILSNPISYGKTMFRFITEQFLQSHFLLGLFMFICGLQDKIASKASGLFLLYSITILYVVFTTRVSDKQICLWQKFVFSLMTIGFLILIPTTMYLAYTPVGSSSVGGVQTRYFIPIFLPALAIIIPRYNNVHHAKDSLYPKLDHIIIFIPYLINLYVVYSIISRGIGF